MLTMQLIRIRGSRRILKQIEPRLRGSAPSSDKNRHNEPLKVTCHFAHLATYVDQFVANPKWICQNLVRLHVTRRTGAWERDVD